MANRSCLLVEAREMDQEMFTAFALFYKQYKKRGSGHPSGVAAVVPSLNVPDDSARVDVVYDSAGQPSGAGIQAPSVDVAAAEASSVEQRSGTHAEEESLPPDRPDKYTAEEYLSRDRKFTAANLCFG